MFYATGFERWKWYQCFDALFRAYSRLRYTTRNVKVRIDISLVMLSHSYSSPPRSIAGVTCTSTEAGPHNISGQTFQCLMQLAGLWNECLFVQFYIIFLQQRLVASASTYCSFSERKQKPWQRSTPTWLDDLILTDVSVKRSFSVTCREEAEVCHIQSDGGDKGLDLASWTFYQICFGCCPEAGGSTLNLGGFSCCCQTEEEMRGYFSLSYVFACYLYCHEKFFR